MGVNVADSVAARLREIRTQAAYDAPAAAATAGARLGVDTVRGLLLRVRHSAGSPTPAPPGTPPAAITGNLARLVIRTPAVRTLPGVVVITWTSTAIYAGVQERGATISVKRAQILANTATGQFFGTSVSIPARPYLRPAMDSLIASGELARVTSDAFLTALGLG